MNMYNFRGDVADISAKKQPLLAGSEEHLVVNDIWWVYRLGHPETFKFLIFKKCIVNIPLGHLPPNRK